MQASVGIRSRLLIPQDGQVSVEWRSGEKAMCETQVADRPILSHAGIAVKNAYIPLKHVSEYAIK